MSSNQNIPELIPKMGGIHSQTVVWRHNKELYQFIGSKCKKCGKSHFPAVFTCGYCGSNDLEAASLKPTGKVLSSEFSVIGAAQGYEDTEPTLYVTVKLDDGILVDGPVVDLPPEIARKQAGCQSGWAFWDSLKDKRVRMVFRRHRKLDNGNIAYGFRFKIEDPPWSLEGTVNDATKSL